MELLGFFALLTLMDGKDKELLVAYASLSNNNANTQLICTKENNYGALGPCPFLVIFVY